MRTSLPFALLAVALLVSAASGRAAPPAPGALVILGGGNVPDGTRERVLALAKADDPRVVILPQASGAPDRGASSVEPWREAGAKTVVVLDPLSEASRAELETADVIWLPGGSQSRLVRELRAAGLLDVLRARHAAGAVVAGSSAGAAVMSRVMITGRADLESVTAGATEVADGFGLWPRVIVDQHFVARRRNNRLISAVLDQPNLVGVGIDEGTGVVVDGETFEVIGAGTVIVYDARGAKVEEHEAGRRHGATNLRVHVLRAGMTLDCP